MIYAKFLEKEEYAVHDFSIKEKDALREQLERHEGIKYFPYKDTEGILTIGIGHNLEAGPLPRSIIDLLFDYDLRNAQSDAMRWLGSSIFYALDNIRKRVVIDMSFNLGYHRLLGFRKCRKAIVAGDFDKAADEMVDSKWYAQVGTRGKTLERMMRTGQSSL